MNIRATLGVLAISVCAMAHAGDGWLTSYDEAVKVSKQTGKPILADFTGSDWCGWCIRLHKEVFSKPKFQSWAKSNVVLLSLDYPQLKAQSKALKEQNQKLQEKYQIEGFPTVLLLEPTGKVIGRSGYAPGGAEPWVKSAGSLITDFKKSSKKKA
jgi:protein disulfide-isomerase